MKKNKITEIGFLILIPMIIILILCIINFKVASGESMKMPFVTSKKTDSLNFTTSKGFGVKLVIHNADEKASEEANKVVSSYMYNEKAGDTDTWNDGMTMTDYEKYKDSLIKVNGQIIDSKKTDKSITYTFENNESVKVNYIKPDKVTKEFALDDSVGKEQEVKFEDNASITKYDTGLVKVEIKNGTDVGNITFKSKYEIDIINLLVHYAVLLFIIIIFYIAYNKIIGKAVNKVVILKEKD